MSNEEIRLSWKYCTVCPIARDNICRTMNKYCNLVPLTEELLNDLESRGMPSMKSNIINEYILIQLCIPGGGEYMYLAPKDISKATGMIGSSLIRNRPFTELEIIMRDNLGWEGNAG